MRHTIVVAAVAAVVVIVALSAIGANAAEDKKADTDARDRRRAAAGGVDGALGQRRSRTRSLAQACHSEVMKLCVKKGSGVGVSGRVGKCLEENAGSITDPVCATWMKARGACAADAQKSGACGAKAGENGFSRACLRTLPEKDLSPECANSDYMKSIRMFGALAGRLGAKKHGGEMKGGVWHP